MRTPPLTILFGAFFLFCAIAQTAEAWRQEQARYVRVAAAGATATPTPTATVTPIDFRNDANLEAFYRFDDSAVCIGGTNTGAACTVFSECPGGYCGHGGITNDYADGSDGFTGSVSDDFTNTGSTPQSSTAKEGLESIATAAGKYLTCTTGNCSEFPASNLDGKQTIACWARPTSLGADRYLFTNSTTTFSIVGWALYDNGASPHKFVYYVANGTCTGTDTVTSTTSISTDTWYHVVGTEDDVNMKLYINATQEGGNVAHTTGFCLQTPLNIGSIGNSATLNWIGQIDECVYFSRALSATEVCSLCRFGIGDGSVADRSSACSSCTYP